MNSDQEEPVTHVTPRGGNVFADLGFDSEEAANLKLRSDLMMQLSAFIEDEGLTQREAAGRMHVSQPRVSDLTRRKVGKLTIDALVNMLSAAGLQVQLHVHEKAA
jgi:predicted XRE-type DNA-binding protein